MDGATHERFMREALEEADQAAEAGEVPVGAVVVRAGQVIARAHNRREMDADPTAHAEVLALRDAAETLGSWRLEDCDLYVTLEPCFMCAGAVVNARVRTLIFGAQDPKAGAVGSLANVPADARLNHRPEIVSGVLAESCGEVLRAFFAARRRGGAARS
ncbi:MAG: tRNA adenosine(34) deaminase TadA [Planctomycetota bacterium]|nr:tRNA adenosine(34) deaminase TadA [Planctomycetota bacterium]